jgi:glycosyltransferase involved in cell wall biosynthesis
MAKEVVRRVLRPVVAPDPLDYTRHAAHFFSRSLQEGYKAHGVQFAKTTLIHHGVDLQVFRPTTRAPEPGTLRCLFVGQLEEHKGVQTALDGLAELLAHDSGTVTLSIVGEGSCQSRLMAHANDRGLARHVHWVGKVPRDRLPAIYGSHDVLIFPSIWEEPFSITILEAMATGMVVVGTQTGGSKEIIRHEETGLVFAPGDAGDIASQVGRLAADRALYARLSDAGTRLIQREFQLDRTVAAVEAFFTEWVSRASPL